MSAVGSIDASDPEVRAAYNDAESLAVFGEWCARRLFGGIPERLPDAAQVAAAEARARQPRRRRHLLR